LRGFRDAILGIRAALIRCPTRQMTSVHAHVRPGVIGASACFPFLDIRSFDSMQTQRTILWVIFTMSLLFLFSFPRH